MEFLQLSSADGDESNTGTTTEDVKEAADIHPSDSPYSPLFLERERDTLSPAQLPGGCSGEDKTDRDELCEQSALEKPEEGSGEGAADKNHEQDVEICGTISDVWSELEDVVCEVIEDEEKEKREADVVKDGEEKTDQSGTSKAGVGDEEEEPQETSAGKLREEEQTTREKHTFHQDLEQKHREGEDGDKEEADTPRDGHTTRPQADRRPPAVTSDLLKDNDKCENKSPGGVGRQLVSKQPKVHQVKAVPVVPPKPQYCRITALTLRQQQQRRDGRDVSLRDPAEQAQRAGEPNGDGDGERTALPKERRRDGAEGTARDARRNSPLSMCFDEAVAIATLRREKERVREGEAEGGGLGK